MKLKISFVLFAPCILFAYAAYSRTERQQAQPSAVCTSELTQVVIELGQGIPLPRNYSNPTGNHVTFKVTMLPNSFFGMAREITQVGVAAHSGVTMSEAAHPTGLHTPLGSARVVFEVTTNRTGADIVGRCDYQVITKAPPGVPGKIPRPIGQQDQLSFLNQVPVRMCVLEGSKLAAGKHPGDVIAGDVILDLLEAVNKDIWFPQAQIAFSTSIDTGFPVVTDPSPPGPTCGALGDLRAGGLAGGDGPFAETECANAWEEKYPGRIGIPVIFARNFCESNQIKGAAAPPHPSLQVKSRLAQSGLRGDDLCGVPKRLTAADITNQIRRPFVIQIEPAMDAEARNSLAHEFGHNLFLGHGNGLDDNNDGKPAGTRGPSPRRYDEYCDPGYLVPPKDEDVAEDVGTKFQDCERSSSLMGRGAPCENLQPLQVETARGVARLMPGFVDGTPVPAVGAEKSWLQRFWQWLRSCR